MQLCTPMPTVHNTAVLCPLVSCTSLCWESLVGFSRVLCWLQVEPAAFVLRRKPAAVIVETAVTAKHGSATGNVFELEGDQVQTVRISKSLATMLTRSQRQTAPAGRTPL